MSCGPQQQQPLRNLSSFVVVELPFDVAIVVRLGIRPVFVRP